MYVVPGVVIVTVTWQLSYMSKKEHLLKEIMDLNRVHHGKQFKESSLGRAEDTPLETHSVTRVMYTAGVIIFVLGFCP